MVHLFCWNMHYHRGNFYGCFVVWLMLDQNVDKGFNYSSDIIEVKHCRLGPDVENLKIFACLGCQFMNRILAFFLGCLKIQKLITVVSVQGAVVQKLNSTIHQIVIFSIKLKLPVVGYNLDLTLVFLNRRLSVIIVSSKSTVLLLSRIFKQLKNSLKSIG